MVVSVSGVCDGSVPIAVSVGVAVAVGDGVGDAVGDGAGDGVDSPVSTALGGGVPVGTGSPEHEQFVVVSHEHGDALTARRPRTRRPSGNGGFRSPATESPRMSYATKFTLGTIGIAALFALALVLLFLS